MNVDSPVSCIKSYCVHYSSLCCGRWYLNTRDSLCLLCSQHTWTCGAIKQWDQRNLSANTLYQEVDLKSKTVIRGLGVIKSGHVSTMSIQTNVGCVLGWKAEPYEMASSYSESLLFENVNVCFWNFLCNTGLQLKVSDWSFGRWDWLWKSAVLLERAYHTSLWEPKWKLIN